MHHLLSIKSLLVYFFHLFLVFYFRGVFLGGTTKKKIPALFLIARCVAWIWIVLSYLYERVSALPPKSGKLTCLKMKRAPRSCVTWHAYQACQVAKRANVRS